MGLFDIVKFLYVAIEKSSMRLPLKCLGKVKFKMGHILYLLSVLILIVFSKRNIVMDTNGRNALQADVWN